MKIKREAFNVCVGLTVYHKTYGKGTVASVHESSLAVDFDGIQRFFQNPQAFEQGILTCDCEMPELSKPFDELQFWSLFWKRLVELGIPFKLNQLVGIPSVIHSDLPKSDSIALLLDLNNGIITVVSNIKKIIHKHTVEFVNTQADILMAIDTTIKKVCTLLKISKNRNDSHDGLGAPPLHTHPDITCLEKYHVYGSSAKQIYLEQAKTFGWDESQAGKFGPQQRLYAQAVTPEGYSVWFLCNNNWNALKTSMWTNVISADGNSLDEYWDKPLAGIYQAPEKRVIFAKKKNGNYVFLGVFDFKGDATEVTTNGIKQWKRTFHSCSEVYPF